MIEDSNMKPIIKKLRKNLHLCKYSLKLPETEDSSFLLTQTNLQIIPYKMIPRGSVDGSGDLQEN